MQFYRSIHKYYDEIFPFEKQKLEFVKSEIKQGSSIIDIGCGTGSLAIALANEGFNVIGIDMSEEMIEEAQNKARSVNPKFKAANMLDISTIYPSGSFDGLLCFGNTLVHLENADLVQNFFNNVYNTLKEGAKFLVQILNYNYILNTQLEYLPSINTNNIEFIRKYEYLENGHICFKTELLLKESGKKLQNEIILYPLKKDEIFTMLNLSGFKDINFFGNFKKEKMNMDSLPLIFSALK